jgi:DNA polymerase-1
MPRLKPASAAACKLFHEGQLAFADIEANGMRIDVPYLHKAIKETKTRIAKNEAKMESSTVWKYWRKEFGSKAKLGSRKQLAHMMFNVYGHPNSGYTSGYDPEEQDQKEARYKADIAALEKIDMPFVRRYLKNEKLKKALGTNLKGILRELHGDRIHPNFWLNTVSTYRSSSTNINFQNQPVRDPEIMRLIRQCFIYDGMGVENDFAGIEVRAAACYNRDPVLIKFLKGAGDMHWDAAERLFLAKAAQMAKPCRHRAKNSFVFAEFYGSWYGDCASGIWAFMEREGLTVDDVPMKKWLRKHKIMELGDLPEMGEKPKPGTYMAHVKKVEDYFWNEQYTVYRDWKKKWYADYCKEGGYNTLTGFRLDGYFKRNDTINHPVQGTAFHWLLWVLIELHKWLKRNKMKSRIVGQVHDSINGDVHPSERDDYIAKVMELVSEGLPSHWDWICVPLEAECEVVPLGKSWADKEKFELPKPGVI